MALKTPAELRSAAQALAPAARPPHRFEHHEPANPEVAAQALRRIRALLASWRDWPPERITEHWQKIYRDPASIPTARRMAEEALKIRGVPLERTPGEDDE